MEFFERIGVDMAQSSKKMNSLSKEGETDLQRIIRRTIAKPTIVNTQSKFVVVTYWWGRGNMNANIARPCISFFEEFINSGINIVDSLLIQFKTEYTSQMVMTKKFDEVIPKIEKTTIYTNYINKFTNVFVDTITYDNKEYPTKIIKGKIQEFNNDNKDDIVSKLREIMSVILMKNKRIFLQKLFLKGNVQQLKSLYMLEREKTRDDTRKIQNVKQSIKMFVDDKKELSEQLKASLKRKGEYELFGKKYGNHNIYDILNSQFRYIEAVKFEDMITNWENVCKSQRCNYMAVEYPQFAAPGGYQMAINAKPLFIKKALELCEGRNVVYIDGDMFIKKYPSIFDMKNVDFMARGWSIDPRSSYKFEESINYDPYTFQTSGGIMFFSQSDESKGLLEAWITESSTKRQENKADDRILSLIFNTKKYALSVNYIQLPIEYLWLTLDYDERLFDSLYDSDENRRKEMNATVFVEHPECLTSEETASGAGASNDRSATFSRFLEMDETTTPVSEEFHEFLMFPNKEMVSSFRSYLDYMRNVVYIDDGNPKLVDNNLITKDNPENNEYAMYIIPYDQSFGKKNTIYENNMEKARQITINNPLSPLGFVELDGNTITDENTIPTILSLLMKGINVCYKPMKFEPSDYAKIINYGRTNLEIVFFPEMNHTDHILKPSIDLNKPMIFRVVDKEDLDKNKVINILSMFEKLDDLSKYLNDGSYQIISRIRIGYVFSDKKIRMQPQMKGGNKKRKFIQDYESGLIDIYPQILQNNSGVRPSLLEPKAPTSLRGSTLSSSNSSSRSRNSSSRQSSRRSSTRQSSIHSSSRKKNM